jgi:hypothetical protein
MMIFLCALFAMLIFFPRISLLSLLIEGGWMDECVWGWQMVKVTKAASVFTPAHRVDKDLLTHSLVSHAQRAQ